MPADSDSQRLPAWLRGAAAKRLLAVALACAVVPAVAVTILAIRSIDDLRARHSQARLATATQQYARALTDRLTLAEEWLESSAHELAPGGALSAARQAWLAERFTSVSLLDAAGQHWPLLGTRLHRPELDDAARNWLADGRYYLHADGAEGQQKRVLLLRAMEPNGTLILAGELSPAFLWSGADALAADMDYCVVSDVGAALSCSRYTQVAGLAASKPEARHNGAGPFAWNADGRVYPARYATVKLSAAFGSGDWLVVARERDDSGAAAVFGFVAAAGAVVLLGVALAAVIAYRMIGRTLAPGAMLVQDVAAMRAAGPDARVRVPSESDLGNVAQAVNALAAQVQAQAKAASMASELDRALLKRTDLATLVQTVLDQVPAIVAADTASITIFDPVRGAKSHTYLRDYHDDQAARMQPDAVQRDAVARALAGRAALWTPKRDLLEMGLEVLLPQLARHFLLLPVMADNNLLALLSLGYRERESITEAEIALPRQLADRLGVATVTARQTDALIRHATLDQLTQLFNRKTLEARLERALADAKRSRHRVAVLFIGLYRFKEVNDTLGHAAGDEVLQEAARRLAACMKKSDTLARVGGDQFAAVLTELVNNRQAMQFGVQMLGALGKPFRVDRAARHLSASVGVSIYPNDSSVPALLLRYANTALSHAEQEGGNRVVFYEEQMSHEASTRATLEQELRTAVERGELMLHYQPRIELRSRRASAAQAVLRWKHPVGGVVSGEQFLPIAEESGLIVPIGAMALRLACKQLSAWDAATLGIARVSLRISARQLAQPDFAGVVEGALRDAQVTAERLELEIGEDILANSVRIGIDTLTKLTQLGVRLAIDDFGGGRYALASLSRLPFHALKLGEPLVSGLESQSTAAMVQGLIGIAHSLSKDVIAEAVATQEQLGQLQTFGCDRVQGSYFSRPVPPADFDAFIADFQSHPWARAA